MSFDVSLVDVETGNPVSVERHEEGGTYAVGGIELARLNITYNYSVLYYRHICPLRGLRCLDGLEAKRAIQVLQLAISQLKTDRVDDYWEPTEGNARHALTILLEWALSNPDAKFKVR